jgi:hypothetical protein
VVSALHSDVSMIHCTASARCVLELVVTREHRVLQIVAKRAKVSVRMVDVLASSGSFLRMSLDAFEEAVTELADHDWAWWPFLWLRPAKHAFLSLGRLFLFSVLAGVPFSVLSTFVVWYGRPEEHSRLPLLLAAFPLAFLFFGSVVIAPMWNRRAERLRAGR